MITAAIIILASFMDPGQVEPSLRIHVQTFIAEAQARGVDLPPMRGLRIKFKPINGAGAYWDRSDSTIWVNSAHRGQGKALMELIIMHELGHAWLQRGHETERTSIMNAEPARILYKKYRKEFLDELFNRTPVFR